MNETKDRIQLADKPTGPGRSTASLIGSLQSRLAAVHLCSGADVIASITSGMAKLGRETSATADGARLRKALAATRAGANGNSVWTKMRLSQWMSGIYPTPVLDQLRNDLALLLADDVEETLTALPIPGEMVGFEAMNDLPDVEFLDVVLGMWSFSRELVASIETVAASSLHPSGSFTAGENPPEEVDGSLLV